jgi:hypothetical protein
MLPSDCRANTGQGIGMYCANLYVEGRACGMVAELIILEVTLAIPPFTFSAISYQSKSFTPLECHFR